jgi:hypothetical protein
VCQLRTLQWYSCYGAARPVICGSAAAVAQQQPQYSSSRSTAAAAAEAVLQHHSTKTQDDNIFLTWQEEVVYLEGRVNSAYTELSDAETKLKDLKSSDKAAMESIEDKNHELRRKYDRYLIVMRQLLCFYRGLQLHVSSKQQQ